MTDCKTCKYAAKCGGTVYCDLYNRTGRRRPQTTPCSEYVQGKARRGKAATQGVVEQEIEQEIYDILGVSSDI